MLIPVDNNSTLVISLHENTFALYYMNVLYAFFVCILISSYGLFFNVNPEYQFQARYIEGPDKKQYYIFDFYPFCYPDSLEYLYEYREF